MMKCDLVVIGGGPAGLAAAASAFDAGVKDILILERDKELGGILNQCIHNGFGLHTFGEELTGPEYAARYVEQVKERGIPCKLDTMVLSISEDRKVTAVNTVDGLFTVEAGAVILAMGCRERSRGALNIPGERPAGIYSAGTAQRLVNMEGYMPGKHVVILGSGDIGLIMARRMTLEGAKVEVVAELEPYSGGLKRNIVQCLDDFGIPLLLSHTVTKIHGHKRVEAVTISEVDANRRPIPGTEHTYECDTLLLSCGLIPENELSKSAGVDLSRMTSGPQVDDTLQTNVEGIFACGNVLHVHDLVDYVSEEAASAGRHAAKYLASKKAAGDADEKTADTDAASKESAKTAETGEAVQPKTPAVPICAIDGVRYTVPVRVHPETMDDEITVRFRVAKPYRKASIVLCYNDREIRRKKRPVMAPGEMEQLVLKKEELLQQEDLKSITIRIAEE